MSERECALKSAAYQKLKYAFEHRREATEAMLKDGKKAVCMIGDDVPEEVIIAGGLTPVRVFGYYGPRPNAEKYLEASFGAFWRGLFEAVLNGEYAGISDRLVFSNSSDLIQKLYHYLEQIKRREPERKLPEMTMVDYTLMVKDYRSQERNADVTKKFIGKVAGWAGREIGDAELRKAIELCNAHRRALRDFSLLRHGEKSRVTGTEALTVISGSFFFEKAEAAELVRRVSEDAATWPEALGKRVFYTGSQQETTEVYELMESAGLNVVSEDKLCGDRYSDADADADIAPYRAIAARYQLRFPSSERGFVAERADAIPKRIREVGAKGMALFMNHNDESYIWDLPKQRERLGEAGVPILSVEQQVWPLANTDELLAKFKSFAEGV